MIDTNRKLVTDFMAKKFPQIKVKKLEATYLSLMQDRIKCFLCVSDTAKALYAYIFGTLR